MKNPEDYNSMQEMNKQLELIQNQLDVLNKQVQELNVVKEGLKGIEKINDEEILVPLGAGVYIKGKVKEKEYVIMNVGAGIAVEKGVKDASKILNEQLESMQEIKKQLIEEMNEVIMTLQKMQLQSK